MHVLAGMVRGIGPREALRRLGVPGPDIRTATWAELVSQVRELEPPHEHGATAAFVMGEHVVVMAGSTSCKPPAAASGWPRRCRTSAGRSWAHP
jgi:hypothetical protein